MINLITRMATNSFSIKGNLVDVWQKTIYTAEVFVENEKISRIIKQEHLDWTLPYILPGFTDSHVHIESSMLIPSEFARLAVVHGTVATVSDPHEIANVCGLAGVEYMIENGKKVPFKFNFGAPSCVPATTFETAGASLDADDVRRLLERDEIKYLSEMMNFPGVLFKDAEVMKKIAAAHELGKPVDGHAPGLRGQQAKQYIEASLNPSEGGTLDDDSNETSYKYQTGDPVMYGLLKDFVKSHRSTPTEAEIVLWENLRGKRLSNIKFRRLHIIGTFIADFVSLRHNLIIEVDGLIHSLPENTFNDKQRTLALKELGFEVIRFTNDQVLYEMELVLDSISKKIKQIEEIEPATKVPPLGDQGAVIISTDHECFTADEALDKLKYGMKILIREGSAAKNFEALIDLLNDYPEMIMFCSDDKHPDSLVLGHINQLCARAVAKGIDVFKVLEAACVNPVLHYKLDVGLLREGDAADFIISEDLKDFIISQTYINGELVAAGGKSFINSVEEKAINQFDCKAVTADDLRIAVKDYPSENGTIPVIEALDGQLITNKLMLAAKVVNDSFVSDVTNDALKMVVVNRYKQAPVAKCFIKNFGLKHGALASSVAHDSHNIVAVGVDDESLAEAINLVIREKGGVSAASPRALSKGEGVKTFHSKVLGLPVAGLMSTDDGYKVAEAYTEIDWMTKEELGSTLASPFMTLSFMALLVIPHLKLSDLGLFDGDKFEFISTT